VKTWYLTSLVDFKRAVSDRAAVGHSTYFRPVFHDDKIDDDRREAGGCVDAEPSSAIWIHDISSARFSPLLGRGIAVDDYVVAKSHIFATIMMAH